MKKINVVLMVLLIMCLSVTSFSFATEEITDDSDKPDNYNVWVYEKPESFPDGIVFENARKFRERFYDYENDSWGKWTEWSYKKPEGDWDSDSHQIDSITGYTYEKLIPTLTINCEDDSDCIETVLGKTIEIEVDSPNTYTGKITCTSSDNTILKVKNSISGHGKIEIEAVGACQFEEGSRNPVILTFSGEADKYYRESESVSIKVIVNKRDSFNIKTSYSKYIGEEDFELDTGGYNPSEFEYSSDNEKVVVVQGNKVKLLSVGSATITVKATSDNREIQSDVWQAVKITVKSLSKPVLSYKSLKGRKCEIRWNQVKGADGYKLQYKKASNSKWKSYNKTISKSAKGIRLTMSSKGYYKFRVRAFTTVNGKKYYSPYKETGKVRIR